MVPMSFLGPIGMWEILGILIIVVFLFGARRIPEIARGMGEGIRGFRTSLKGDTLDEKQDEKKDEESQT